jgi:hypothetical protein
MKTVIVSPDEFIEILHSLDSGENVMDFPKSTAHLFKALAGCRSYLKTPYNEIRIISNYFRT